MTSPAELSSLKTEVAELWKRFKSEDRGAGVGADDPVRKEVAEAVRALDVRQKELTVRRSALRQEQDLVRARSAVRLPAFRALGWLGGLLLGSIIAALTLADVAAVSVGLAPAWGAVMLVAVLPFPMLLPRR